MTEFDVLTHPHYQRGMFMLLNQIESPAELVQLWTMYGTYRSPEIPSVEYRFPWNS